MRKSFILKSLLFILLSVFLFSSVAVEASELAVVKGETILAGELTEGVTYESFSGTTTTDAGTQSNQRMSYVKKTSDNLVEVVAWSKLGTTSIIGANMIELAQDFENKNPGYTVIAGINGDYYDPTTKTPVNALVQNGDLVKNYNFSQPRYFSIGIKDNALGYVRNKVNEVESNYFLTIYDKDTDRVLKEVELVGINQFPGNNQTSIYYNSMQSYTFSGVKMFDASLSTRLNYGTLLLKGSVFASSTTSTTDATKLTIATQDAEVENLLQDNPKIRIQKNLKGANNAIDQVIGVGSQVLQNGEVLSFEEIGDQNLSFASARAPRSSIGFGANGEVIIATMDGRQFNMAGVNLREEAQVMQSLGAVNAFNFDGGGSTQLIIKENGTFKFINSPTEPNRKNANGILFVVPDVKVDLDIDEVRYDAVDVLLRVRAQSGIQIDEVSVYVDGEKVSHVLGENTLSFVGGKAHFISVEIRYQKNGVSYTRIFKEKRIHPLNYDVEVIVPPKQKPADFALSFVKREDINGFEVIIDFHDPDNTLHMLFLLYDQTRVVALKYQRGYVVEIPNVTETTDFSFQIEYQYRINTITPVVEYTSTPFGYQYVVEVETIPPMDEEEQTGCKSIFSLVLVVPSILLMAFSRKRKK